MEAEFEWGFLKFKTPVKDIVMGIRVSFFVLQWVLLGGRGLLVSATKVSKCGLGRSCANGCDIAESC